jgi:hypothetical protein
MHKMVFENKNRLRTIVSLGCAPSSGSTFLADLLDSAPSAVCPPELYTLCAPRAYTFDAFFRDRVIAGDLAVSNASIYGVPRLWFNRKYFDILGLDNSSFTELVRAAADLQSFLESLSDHLSNYLERSIDTFFEKTPVNIGTANLFLSTFANGWFVSVVRNGFSVVGSLNRRHFSVYEAALVWLFCLHRLKSLKNGRVLKVSYEALVADPFGETVDLLNSIGIELDPCELERNFHSNPFRTSVSRPTTWSHSAMSLPLAHADVPPWLHLPEETVALLAHSVLHDTSKEGDTYVLSFRTAMEELGYEVPSVTRLPNEALIAAEKAYQTSRKDQRWHPWRLSFDDVPLRSPVLGFPAAGASTRTPVFTL